MLEQLATKYSNICQCVRGMRLMLGLVVKDNPKLIIEKLREKGILACSAGYDVVRFVPPLIISKEEVNIVIDALDDVLSKF